MSSELRNRCKFPFHPDAQKFDFIDVEQTNHQDKIQPLCVCVFVCYTEQSAWEYSARSSLSECFGNSTMCLATNIHLTFIKTTATFVQQRCRARRYRQRAKFPVQANELYSFTSRVYTACMQTASASTSDVHIAPYTQSRYFAVRVQSSHVLPAVAAALVIEIRPSQFRFVVHHPISFLFRHSRCLHCVGKDIYINAHVADMAVFDSKQPGLPITRRRKHTLRHYMTLLLRERTSFGDQFNI